MIIYLTLPILIVMFIKKINSKKNTFFDFIILTLMILICGLRYNVGTDYNIYTRMFLHTELFDNIEILFKTLILLIKNLFNENVYVYFFITALITMCFFKKAIKENAEKPGDSLFYFICLGYYALSFNTIRQMIAASIMLYATKYMIEKKAVKYWIATIIAGLFHTTAFIMIPFYYFANIKFDKKMLKIIFTIMLIGVIAYQPVFEFVTSNVEKYKSYAEINHYTYSEAGYGTYVIAIFHIILITLIIKKRNELIEKNPKNQIYINLVIVSIFFYLLSLENTVAVRPGYYFSIYLIYILPDLFKTLFKHNYARNIILTTIFFIIYYMVHLISFNTMLPYNTILFMNL